MRWFLIPAVATAAVAFADPAPAKAQVIVGYPAYSAPFPRPVVPFSGVVPGNSGVIPFVNGGPVEYALNTAFRSLGMNGLGPYAGHYTPYGVPRYFGGAYPGYYDQWGTYRPFNAPATRWVDPWSGNPGLHKGWYKGGGKGGVKGGGKGKGKGGKGGKGR
jgi:hypothetical protein